MMMLEMKCCDVRKWQTYQGNTRMHTNGWRINKFVHFQIPCNFKMMIFEDDDDLIHKHDSTLNGIAFKLNVLVQLTSTTHGDDVQHGIQNRQKSIT